MGQQLTMTPQLQQAIRLLQLSTLDLQQEIQEALDSNPMLENEEPGSEDFGDTPSDNNADNSADNNADNSSNPDELARDDSLNEYSASAGDNSDDYGSSDDYNNSDYNNSDSGDEASTPDNQEVGDHLSNEQLPDDLPVDSNWDDTYQPTAGVASGSGPIDKKRD